MRALHPFMPFLTEELWQRFIVLMGEEERCESICLRPYPLKGEKPTFPYEEEALEEEASSEETVGEEAVGKQ